MKNKSIFFFEEDVRFLLRNKNAIRNWIISTFQSEQNDIGIINYIFCSDNYLHEINMKYLKHDTLTDIITFSMFDNEKEISGDIFISIDRIKENAQLYKISFRKELHRVIIHGILHLIGYDDKTPDDIEMMRKKEDYYLSLLPNFIS